MVGKLVEHGIENAVDNLLDDKTARIVKTVGKAAVKQAGKSIKENNHLIGKKTLVVAGAAIVVAQAAATAIGLVVLHKAQEKRMERVVRKVVREEIEKAKVEA